MDDLEYTVHKIYCIFYAGVYVMKIKRGLQLQNEIYMGNLKKKPYLQSYEN